MILFKEDEKINNELKKNHFWDKYNNRKQRLQSCPRLERNSDLPKDGKLYWELDHQRGGGLVLKHFPVKTQYGDHDVMVQLHVFEPDFPGDQLNLQMARLSSLYDAGKITEWAEAEMQKYLNEETQETDEPLEPLPDDLRGWFNVEKWQASAENDLLQLTVRETKKWRENIITAYDQNMLSEIHNKLSCFYWDNLKDLEKEGCLEREDPFFAVTIASACIFCRYVSDPATEARELTLIDICFDGDEQTLAQWKRTSRKEYTEQSDKLFPLPKSYPGVFLCHDNDAGFQYYEKWLGTERDGSVANLAMSGEEMQILHQLTSDNDAMPSFIDGPAGSGKSTILHYLFVHYWHHKQTGKLKGRPIFITLSESLLDKARAVIREILTLELSQEQCPTKPDDENFFPFRLIMKEIVGLNNSRYTDENEIDFDAFKNLLVGSSESRFPRNMCYQKKRLKKEITPELCWHIIRSYIKGNSADYYLVPNDFKELRSNGLFVSQENYQEVFEQVWPWYCGITSGAAEKKYWDQQDLAREALNRMKNNPSCLPEKLRDITAIFCDEAQDLTGVELQIVQRLSILTKYDLQYEKGLPFAFAGDPLQSLNPSGFRWEDLRASMYSNLTRQSNCSYQLEMRELTLNYRSPKDITHLANLVQLFRRYIFGDRIHVQEPVNTDSGVPVTHFYDPQNENPLSAEDLEHLRNSIVLLPCASGHENAFIEEHPILKQIKNSNLSGEGDGDQNFMFMSVMTAKGLEIKNVVVFAFGETLFQERLSVKNSEDIALAYAFNQLYVALTRSTNQLLILDTQRGNENLWKVIFDDDNRKRCLSSISDAEERENWKKYLPNYNLTTESAISNLLALSPEAEYEQAKVFEANARETHDPNQMHRAANFFERSGHQKDAKRCRAFAYKYSKRYEEAADLFKSIGEGSDIVNCLWDGRLWNRLYELDSGVPENKRTVAEFMRNENVSFESVDHFLQNENNVIPRNEPQWQEVMARLCRFAGNVSEENVKQHDKIRVMIKLADYLSKHEEFENTIEAAGHLWVVLGKWDRAAKLREGYLSPKEAKLVNAHTKPWPEYILPCRDMQNNGGLQCFCERWSEDKNDAASAKCALDDEQKDAVVFLLVKNNLTDDAIDFALCFQHIKALKEHFKAMPDPAKIKTLQLILQKNDGDVHFHQAARKNISPQKFASEFLFLQLAINAKDSWERATEILSSLAKLPAEPHELRSLFDFIFKSKQQVRNSSSLFAQKLCDLCCANFAKFEKPDDLQRAAAAFEAIGLGLYYWKFGKEFADRYVSNPKMREIAAGIYVRGRYVQKTSSLQPFGEDFPEETKKQLRSWGCSEALMLNESKEIAPPVSTGNAANWRESRDADTITLTTPPSLTPPLIVMINRDTFSVISKSNFMQIFSIERFAPNMVVLSNGGSRDLNGGKITIKSGGDELEVSGSENALVIKYSVWKTAAAPINIRQMQNELSRGR